MYSKFALPRKRAFSLVELSIVLVILGLLVGGILSGQALIRAAEMRSVVTEYQKYYAATQAFRDKYFALPGDFNNATAFWGKDNTNCTGDSGAVGSPGTCNGDGSGIIDYATGPALKAEFSQYWKQLALAGLVEGTYSGIAGPTLSYQVVVGTTAPRSRIANGGWSIVGLGVFAGDIGKYALDYGNAYALGSQTGGWTNGYLLKPEEAWNIDTKLDDGKPGMGKVIADHWPDCTSSTSMTDLTGSYQLGIGTAQCSLYFPRVM